MGRRARDKRVGGGGGGAAAHEEDVGRKPEQQYGGDLISNKLPDAILARILSVVDYRSAVRASATSRRWKNLYLQLPRLILHFKDRGAAAMKSMERMLRRRCGDGEHCRGIQALRVVFGADAPSELQHAATFIKLADAPTLEVCAECVRQDLPVDGAGAWSLELPPRTVALTLWTSDFAIQVPRIHGPGFDRVKKLELDAYVIVRDDTTLSSALRFPALDDLSILSCSLAADAGLVITSAAMPRLKHLRISDVTIVDAGRPGSITVDVEELATLHMSCSRYCRPLGRGEAQWAMFRKTPFLRASHTVYSFVHLRAPKLRVLSWNMFWAYDVRIQTVGRLLLHVDVLIPYGVMPTIDPEEIRTITREEAHALMRSIIAGLLPGLRHLGLGSLNNILRDVCELHQEQKLLLEIK